MTMTDIIKWALLFLALNLLVFSIYFMDKQASRHGRRRISERTLLVLALIGGSLGALAAQHLLRHKTRKEPFRSILAAILILHGALIAVLGLRAAMELSASSGFLKHQNSCPYSPWLSETSCFVSPTEGTSRSSFGL
ncbi:DUF1294 domain-containing protein [Rhizobium leguminosarum]|nr:DUF1294 domain-containing protein [Rhizobium leguminosarum]